jgi:hypothetical protein
MTTTEPPGRLVGGLPVIGGLRSPDSDKSGERQPVTKGGSAGRWSHLDRSGAWV